MACSLLVTLAVQWTCWISLNSVVTSLLLIKAENKAELLFLTGVEEYSFEIKNSGKIRLLKSINGGKSTLEIMELSIIELSEVYKNEHKINSIHSIFNISNVILNVSNESVIEKYGIAAVFRSLSIVMREDIRFNVDCIMYKSATRKKVSGANFLIKKGTVEFEISIKRLKFCGRNSTCMIKNQNETESFFNVVLETKAPYFTTITKNRFQFDNLDLIFSAMYRNSSGYSFNVDMENPNMISSSVGTTFTISLPSNKSEYYYSIVANENENMAPDIDTLFNNVSVQVRKQSGLTSILRTNKNNKRGKVLDIKIYSVEEVDRFGNKIEEKGHFIRNFSNQFFNISQVSKALKYGLIATVFNFTLFFENASISIEFIIFNSSGNILVESGETYNIVPGTMKFNIVIRDWIFCGTQKATCKTGIIGSYLDLQLEMKGAASKTRKTKETKLSNKFKVQKSLKSKYLPISFDIDQSTATFSSMVYINGNWTDMPVGFPRYNNINNDSLFIMRFPLSKSEIIYDPVIEVLPDGINSSAQLTFIPSIFLLYFFHSVYIIKA